MRNYVNVLPKPIAEPASVPEPIPVSSLRCGIQSVYVETDRGASFALVAATKRGRRPGAFHQRFPVSIDKPTVKGRTGHDVLNDDGMPAVFTIGQDEIVEGGELRLVTLDGWQTEYRVRRVEVHRLKRRKGTTA